MTDLAFSRISLGCSAANGQEEPEGRGPVSRLGKTGRGERRGWGLETWRQGDPQELLSESLWGLEGGSSFWASGMMETPFSEMETRTEIGDLERKTR